MASFKKADLFKIIYYITFCGTFCFAFGCCSDLSIIGSIIIAALYPLFFDKPDNFATPFFFLNYLTAYFLSEKFGVINSAIAFLLSGILLLFLLKTDFAKKLYLKNSVKSGLSLGCSFSVTAIVTNLYFGIGANGSTALEMIKSYLCIGFHPNWRGILFGTIVLVVMITFPRKFKKFSKIFSASFAALIITGIFNWFLMPENSVQFIKCIDLTELNCPELYFSDYTLTVDSIIYLILSTFSITLINFYGIGSKDKQTERKIPAYAVISSILAGYYVTGNKNKRSSSFFIKIISSISIIIIFILIACYGRIPGSSAAVILIAAAWQTIKWGDIKVIFESYKNIIEFVLCAVIFSLTNPVIGIIFALLLSQLINHLERRNINVS